MTLKFADLHNHSTLRPFAEYCIKKTSEKASIWYQQKPKEENPSGRAKNYTQSDFTSLVEGGVKMAFTAMYPIEQGWFNLFDVLNLYEDKEFNEIIKNFNEKTLKKHLNQKLNFIPNNTLRTKLVDYLVSIIGHWVTSLPQKRIEQIMKPTYNYFEALLEELDYLKSQCVEKKDILPQIPNGNAQLRKLLRDRESMIVIPTIEGAASFVNGNAKTIHNGEVDFGKVLENIVYVKKKYNLFFVTLSHHFYNGFNGHAQSIYGEGRMFIDQMFGKGNIITSHGWDVIETLLSVGKHQDSGYRVLIDTKHMSVPARLEYYKFIELHNKNNPNDIIPIISSHSSFSGLNLIENIGQNSSDYSDFEVNIATQEIEAIYKSGGLIGLNFDQNVLSKKPKELGKDKTKKWTDEDWAELLVDNLLGMIEALDSRNDIKNSNVWNIFTIGSDFDGFIDPMNSFSTSVQFLKLQQILTDVLNKNKLFKKLSFGLSAQEVIRRFMWKNAMTFLLKHYHSEIKNNQTTKEAINNIEFA